MENGRYRNNSAWAFDLDLEDLRDQGISPANNPDIWENWYLTSDGIPGHRAQYWNGTAWVKLDVIKVRMF